MNRCLIVAFAIFAFTGDGQSQEKQVVMTRVKYDGLQQEILKHRGKVVVLDFWSTKCPPCMASFHKFVKMHEKYADKGIVVISISLDDFNEKEDVDRANRFLTSQKSTMLNLLLVDPPEVWAKKLEYESLPFYYLFDRHGKWVRYRAFDYKTGVPYDELEKTVVQMLNEK